MDAGFVNAYLVAVQNVFKTMLRLDIAMGKPALKKDRHSSGDVTGVIGFAGDKKGSFSLAFVREGAMFVYKRMIGEDVPSVTADVVDAIGELTNIVSGQTRVQIEKLGYKLNAALPTVVVGHNVEINFITKVPLISLPFTYEADGEKGQVFLDFSFE
ncbi:MAG: chemotaxis protein CheX [Syntrophorhabdales bacterium]|jgi:chemotaxis protein CheX